MLTEGDELEFTSSPGAEDMFSQMSLSDNNNGGFSNLLAQPLSNNFNTSSQIQNGASQSPKIELKKPASASTPKTAIITEIAAEEDLFPDTQSQFLGGAPQTRFPTQAENFAKSSSVTPISEHSSSPFVNSASTPPTTFSTPGASSTQTAPTSRRPTNQIVEAEEDIFGDSSSGGFGEFIQIPAKAPQQASSFPAVQQPFHQPVQQNSFPQSQPASTSQQMGVHFQYQPTQPYQPPKQEQPQFGQFAPSPTPSPFVAPANSQYPRNMFAPQPQPQPFPQESSYPPRPVQKTPSPPFPVHQDARPPVPQNPNQFGSQPFPGTHPFAPNPYQGGYNPSPREAVAPSPQFGGYKQQEEIQWGHPSMKQSVDHARTQSFEEIDVGFRPQPGFSPMPSPAYGAQIPVQNQHYQSGYQEAFNASTQQNVAAKQAQLWNWGNQLAKPVVSFGFGGKIVVMFPKRTPKLNVLDPTPEETLPFSQTGSIRIQDFSSALGNTSYGTSMQYFPGPLAQTSNKQELASYIDYEISKIQQSNEYSVAAKATALKQLWQLLKVMLLNDQNTEQGMNNVIAAVKNILLEHKRDVSTWSNDSSYAVGQSKPENELQQDIAGLERLLMDGKVEDAVQFASNAKLWGHALVLAIMTDKATYQKVAASFAQAAFPDGSPLKTLYLTFADRGDLLFQPQTMIRTDSYGNVFASQQQQPTTGRLVESWEENLSMILANRTNSSGKVIERLGDTLLREHGLVEAAHVCYLVADYCTGHEAFRNRVTLLGTDPKRDKKSFITPSSLQRSELYELVKQRITPNYFLPSLQTYKLIYATWLAEYGHLAKANQYIESIVQVVEKTKQQFAYSPHFIYQVRVLRHRIVEVEKIEKTQVTQLPQHKQQKSGGVTSWIFGKIDVGLTKFIHGDASDEAQSPAEAPKSVTSAPIAQPAPAKPTQAPAEPEPKQEPKQQPKQEQEQQQEAGQEKKGSWLSWLPGFKKGTREINYGVKNSLVWNEKAQAYIPAGANPDDYIRMNTPKPPDASLMAGAAVNFSAPSAPGGLSFSSRYAGTSGFNVAPAQTTPSTGFSGFAPVAPGALPPVSAPFFVPTASAQPAAEEQVATYSAPQFNQNWGESQQAQPPQPGATSQPQFQPPQFHQASFPSSFPYQQ